jgi:two-component system, NtrC family, sensor kinase
VDSRNDSTGPGSSTMSDNEQKTIETTERLNNLGHLSAGVGHHVINAFSAIVSNAELLRLKPPIPSVVDPAALADTIVKTALEAATVARRLIDYTRPVTSTDPDTSCLDPSAIALDRLVDDFVAEQRAVGPPDVEWVTDLASLPPIRGHSFQLRGMLGHLVGNSFDAMPGRKGTIWVSASTDSRGWVVLELRDSGQGMESETMVRAVEPFFSTKPGHLGVGLSIANGIWRRHRGTLSLRSQPGEGTVLRLCVEPLQA